MRYKVFDNQTITVFMIEGKWPRTAGGGYANTWGERSLTAHDFGETPPKHNDNWNKVCPLWMSREANGVCWQRTGINGWLDEKLALKAWAAFQQFVKPRDHVVEWRLVRRKIKIKATKIKSFAAAVAPLRREAA